MFTLKNKNIVITGSLGLLGSQFAEIIAEYHGNPILIDLSQKELDQQANSINKKYNVNSRGYSIDISDESSFIEKIKTLKNDFKKIDGLINNAANNPKVEDSNNSFSRLEHFDIQNWNDDLNVGLKGSFLCIKYFGTEIANNPLGGSIINISSDLGLIAPDQSLYVRKDLPDNQQPVKPVTYSVIKTGLIGLTRYVATYWAKKGVRCNALCPGGVENNQNPDFIKKINSKIPMNRMAKKNEYNGSIIYLLSDASSYINGAIIAADGGRTTW
tara:strand:- start:15312 stop:16124 length:813 start_codon:yes stop_codon:yes gene_type:complete